MHQKAGHTGTGHKRGTSAAMADGRRSNPSSRRARAPRLCLLAAILADAGSVRGPGRRRAEGIESFTSGRSNTHAGGHPDLSTSFTLENPGDPEAAQNVIFNAPEGVFGNPYAITHCTSSDFALDQCPPNSQAGLITVYANYEGDPQLLLGTAPIFDLEPPDQTALLRLHRADLNIPINIPVAVRTAERLRPSLHRSGHHPADSPCGRRLTFWGFPAAADHEHRTLPERLPRRTRQLPGLAEHQLPRACRVSEPASRCTR